MKKVFILILITAITGICISFTRKTVDPIFPSWVKTYEDTLLYWYTQPSKNWPKPTIDSGVVWTELGIVPESPLKQQFDVLKDKIELGKLLFFDPRLSGSGQISCASCHVPDLSWTDGREKSAGHDQQMNKRNAPTILNSWFYKNLFWDGRSSGLADQAFGPINSETEMHSSMSATVETLEKIEGYKPLFQKAFGSPEINPETVTEAIATFEKTVVSRKAAFDKFLAIKDTVEFNKAALRGLHLFRTKARCMNCHNGALFTDNSFHNIGLTYYGREYEDLGRYKVTHKPEDVGKFKTPSLRDVIRTRPWMHNGLFDNIEGVLNIYNSGMPVNPKPGQENDPLFPKTDPLIKKLNLTKAEKADLIAFLESITAQPWKMRQPILPGR